MKPIKDKKLWNSKKKKSNRDGKVCREFRRLRKRARQLGKKEIYDPPDLPLPPFDNNR